MDEWAEYELYQIELNEYMNRLEEQYMEEIDTQYDCVEWNHEAWAERDERAYSIVSVMAGAIMEKGQEHHFEEMVRGLGAKHEPLLIGQAVTLPDLEDRDHPLPETGGRHDLFFAFHNLDIARVAVPRLMYGIRWWSDVVDNEWNNLPLEAKTNYREHTIYPAYVFETVGFGESEIVWSEEE